MFTVKCAFITSRCLQRSTTWFYKRILSDEAAFTVNTHNRVTMPSNSHTMQHKTSLSTLPYYGILHQASVSTKEYTPSSPTLQLYKYSINPQLQHNTSFSKPHKSKLINLNMCSTNSTCSTNFTTFEMVNFVTPDWYCGKHNTFGVVGERCPGCVANRD